jgi:Holliday junction resolvasome RuvABC endonuclease subunit
MTKPVILAITLRAQRLAIAIFAERRLTYYRICSLNLRGQQRLSVARGLIEYFVGRYKPDLLAIESLVYIQQQIPSLLSLSDEIVKTASKLGVEVDFISPADIRAYVFHEGEANKFNVARKLVALYPELSFYLDSTNASPQQYGLHIFNAVALGLYVADMVTLEKLPQFNSKSCV